MKSRGFARFAGWLVLAGLLSLNPAYARADEIDGPVGKLRSCFEEARETGQNVYYLRHGLQSRMNLADRLRKEEADHESAAIRHSADAKALREQAIDPLGIEPTPIERPLPMKNAEWLKLLQESQIEIRARLLNAAETLEGVAFARSERQLQTGRARAGQLDALSQDLRILLDEKTGLMSKIDQCARDAQVIDYDIETGKYALEERGKFMGAVSEFKDQALPLIFRAVEPIYLPNGQKVD